MVKNKTQWKGPDIKPGQAFAFVEYIKDQVVRALDRMERRTGAKFREVFRSITVDHGYKFQDCKRME